MGGFNSIVDVARADEAGRVWQTQFRKMVASAATTTSGLIDYLYFAGSLLQTSTLSSPAVSALVETSRGIYIPSVSPCKQFIKTLTTMRRRSATTTTSQRQRLIVADYLLYYPFIDTDAVGEKQALENTVTIPRYNSGASDSCRAICCFNDRPVYHDVHQPRRGGW